MCTLTLFYIKANRESGRVRVCPIIPYYPSRKRQIRYLSSRAPTPSFPWFTQFILLLLPNHLCSTSGHRILKPAASSSALILVPNCQVLAFLLSLYFLYPTYPFWHHVGSGYCLKITAVMAYTVSLSSDWSIIFLNLCSELTILHPCPFGALSCQWHTIPNL